MTRDPIRRRFGKGAARLRVALPPDVEPLSAVARTPIRLERRLTLVPVLTALAIAWLLGTRPEALPPLVEREPIQVVFETPPVAPTRPVPAPRPEAKPPSKREPVRGTPRRAPESVRVARRGPSPSPRPEASTAPPAQARPFDPNALATRGAHWSEAEARAAEHASAELLREGAAEAVQAAGASRALRDAASGPLPSAVASASRAARSATLPTSASEGAASALPLASRPGARPGEGGPSDALVSDATAGTRARVAALAALDRSAARADAAGRGAAPSERRPEVSAPRTAAPLLSGSSSGTALDGWEEVPLDELPDCSPPGRQDLLKKRILLAASVRQECSHASGSYRFVEARSLGAFLMWSRPNADRRAGQPRDRDACDVLERALACLGDRSSQESKSR